MHTATHTPSSTKQSHATHALGYALAVAVGAALGLIFSPKDGSSIRKGLLNKIKDLSHHFTKSREELQAEIQDIWGEVTEELEKQYVELRSHLVAAVDEVKDKARFTRKQFEGLIDDVVTDFAADVDWSHSATNRLTKHLKGEYEDIKKSFSLESGKNDEE